MGGSGTSNFIPKFSSQFALTDSTLFDNGNVGIGTTNPLHKLSVNGTTNISGAATLGSTLDVTGLAVFDSGIGVNGDTITDFTGTGLTHKTRSQETTQRTPDELNS
jgi:hypothetical protein